MRCLPFSAADAKFVRRLSISLDYREYTGAVAEETPRRMVIIENGDEGNSIEAVRDDMHGITTDQLMHRIWYPMFKEVTMLKLDYLQINLQNCYCPWGCDRMIFDAFTSEGNAHGIPALSVLEFLRHQAPQTIHIIGTLNEEVREYFRAQKMLFQSNIDFHGGCSEPDSDVGYWKVEEGAFETYSEDAAMLELAEQHANEQESPAKGGGKSVGSR